MRASAAARKPDQLSVGSSDFNNSAYGANTLACGQVSVSNLVTTSFSLLVRYGTCSGSRTVALTSACGNLSKGGIRFPM